jgi:hypothetical protein
MAKQKKKTNEPAPAPVLAASNPALVPPAGTDWIESTGTLISFCHILPAVVRYRSLHNEMIDEMYVNLRGRWNCSFSMIVVRVMNSDGTTSERVNVIDGSHRYAALQRNLEEELIRPDYKVQCTVYRSGTPSPILHALAGKTNLDNESFQRMTVPDKVHYLVIVLREVLQTRNPALLNDSGCLWIVTRNEVLAAMAQDGSNHAQFASGDSVMDGLLSLVRCWVSVYDLGMWAEHQQMATRRRYASVWQVVSFLNEQGSEYWLNFRERMNDMLVAAEIAGDGDGPEKSVYAAELKARSIFTYHASYPGTYSASPYNRANLKLLPAKHRRPQIEFVMQRTALQFMLTGKAASKSFTNGIPTQLGTEGIERQMYDLWMRAHEIRHDYDDTMAGTFWLPVSKCAWPSCHGKLAQSTIGACDICETDSGAVYTCCLDCSKINALGGHWSDLPFHLQGAGEDVRMRVCPTCAVAFMVRTYANPTVTVRTAWPHVSAALEKEECVRCFVGYGCSAHETRLHWSKGPGKFVLNSLALQLQTWLKQEHPILVAIFTNLEDKRYHRVRREEYLVAREVEFKIAAGSQDLSLWHKLDPAHKVPVGSRPGGLLGTVASMSSAPTGGLGLGAFEEKLLLYKQLENVTGPKLAIENLSWQQFWQKAQADTTHAHRAIYTLVIVDPMYNYEMDAAEFATFRAMLNYVTAPGAILILFHAFLHLAAWGLELSKAPKTAKVSNT